jgi:hypothetical protein
MHHNQIKKVLGSECLVCAPLSISWASFIVLTYASSALGRVCERGP